MSGPALVDGAIVDALIEIDGDRIITVAAADGRLAADVVAEPTAHDVDAVDGTLLPAYVDLHCHGGGGTAFTDLDPDAAAVTARHHHERGSTSLLASLVTMSAADLERGVSILADLADDGLVDGIHLEGPWISKARCGAHDPGLVRDAARAEVDRLLDLGRGHIRQVTLAPERETGLELVRWLAGAGVHAAVGHTTATFGQVEAAVDAGADLATHLFNGMEPWHHRSPGAVPALLRAAAAGAMTLELIADGVHLDDATARTVVDLVGRGRVAFVSDAMAAAGMGDGRYVLGGLPVVVRGGVARLGRDADEASAASIAGGTSHLADIVARAVAAGLPVPYAAQCASGTPAALLGLDDRGAIRPGSRADLVVVDDGASVTRVMRAGRWLGP
ncbi:N-acetylglucosamine-6-phosphate deacetylase [Intrasporangium sp.]|uniref:N-acetylglucosamine-6-phosphate deacetylase n=1 Tax=Intrasporangium sp. TaxID=1925024 RepID=UPI002D784E55|nr:amidohydrolase family protein [Intrasporangium sp.]